MISAANQSRRLPAAAIVLALLAMGLAGPVAAGISGPDLEKAFAPDTIGPGSTSTLTFTIGPAAAGTTDIAFDDEFPAGVTFSSPALVSNECGGTVTIDEGDADSDFDVRLEDGVLGPGATCTIVVNTTSSTPGTHMNVSGPLSSSAGGGDTAADDLTVVTDRPGFSKSFSPNPVAFGGRSTLTFLIDNMLNASAVAELDFTDVLPAGMTVASPSNKMTDCKSPSALLTTTLTAVPGSSTITLDANGTAGFPVLAAASSCTVVVDVIGGAVGDLGNVSDTLVIDLTTSDLPAGKAAAVLEVTGFAAPLSITKRFLDDPAPPGGTVTLEFTVTNRSRDDAATGIGFSDDLDMGAALGLTPTLPPTPDPPCGAGSVLSYADPLLTLTGGSLAPESSCTFSVVLTVPGGTTPGTYTNTTGAVSGDVGGMPETGNMASDQLFIVAFPVLTKEFTVDPVGAGGTTTIEFTITNPASSVMTDIAFIDELTDNSGFPASGAIGNGFLPSPVSVTLPGGSPCDGSLTLVSLGTDRAGLSLTGASLAADDAMPGGPDTCSFTVDVDIPEGFPSGTYTNTTEEITATLSGSTVTGPQAGDTILVGGTPVLDKEFTDDPVLPSGGSATLVFTLFYDVEEGVPDATAIAFTDDLAAVLPGTPDLSAASVDVNTCSGATVDIITDPEMIDVSGGTLMAGESCTIEVTVTVPAGAPVGFHTNTTSKITSTTAGIMATGDEAEDDLLVTPLLVTKEFTDDPVIPGDVVTLVFTLENIGTSMSQDASAIAFSDALSAILPGTPDITRTGAPTVNTCGGTEAFTMGTSISYSGGSLGFGETCTVAYELLVPAGAADGEYPNVSGSPTATIDGSGVTLPPATDILTIDSELIAITKEFTDDPVLPDSDVTLKFTLTNLSATETVTDIAFDDDLDAALSGLEATGATMNDCGGMAAGFPAGLFEYSDGTLTPGASCMIVLTVHVPAAPLPGSVFLNTTTDASGKVGPLDVFGAAASDDLIVQLQTLTKSFDGATVATGTAVLTFTITNFDSSGGVTDLAFSDDLDAVVSGLTAALPPSPDPPCGAGSALSGTSFLSLTGGSLAAAGSPGDSCSFSVTVTVPATATAGSFLNTTSELFRFGLPLADPATAFLDIEPPPAFSKLFDPDEIAPGGVSTLTFTIDNTASGFAATLLDFTDVLPAGLVVATPSGAATTCAGGTLTAGSGSGTISYTGGSVPAGASCTVTVDVTTPMAGTYVNTSGDLTSSNGNSGPASDTLTVLAADLELVKEDLFEPVMTGGYQVYTLTVTNLGPDTAESVVLTDVVPAGATLVIPEPLASCGAAGGIVTCAAGDLGVGASFTATITVYVELTGMPLPLENLASTTSDTADPDPGNNDVLEATEVLPRSGLAALDDVDGNLFPEVAVPLPGSIDLFVKDVDSGGVLHQTEVFPDGWALAGFEKAPMGNVAVMAVEPATGAAEVRVASGLDGTAISTSLIPANFLPTSLAVIPDDGTGRTLLVVGAVSTKNGSGWVMAFKASNGALVAMYSVHPNGWPVAVAGVASFAGGPTAEVGVLWINRINGRKKLWVQSLNGIARTKLTLPIEMSPLGMATVPDCCGGPSDELAAMGWDRALDRVRVQTLEADGGALVNAKVFGAGGQPIDVEPVSGDVATLFRNSSPRAALRVHDLPGGANVVKEGENGGSVPLGLGVSADAYGTVADDVSVYWLDPGSGLMFVTVRDGAGGIVAAVPIP